MICMYYILFIHLSIQPWGFVVCLFVYLFLPFCFFESCCYEQGCTNTSSSLCFQFFGYIPGRSIAESYGKSYGNFFFFEELPYYFLEQLLHFTFSPTVPKVPIFPHPSPCLHFMWQSTPLQHICFILKNTIIAALLFFLSFSQAFILCQFLLIENSGLSIVMVLGDGYRDQWGHQE